MNAKPKLQRHARSFFDSLHDLLTPAMWKQANQARHAAKASPRWKTQPLVLTLLAMTWCCGDSQAERFETARGFTAVWLQKRRQPGQSVQGFQDALAALPMSVLRVLANGVRRCLLTMIDLTDDGFVVFGCDGSSMETPRTEELEKRLDPAVKERGGPQVWVTALVHVRTGLLWAWHLGKGYNRERSHLQALLPTLPPHALIVADAGYNGYDLACALTAAGVSFLIRMSGKDRLYTKERIALTKFTAGEVFVWTKDAQRRAEPPLRARLLCIRAKDRRDVWLLTNVLDEARLPAKRASQYYRWRWENEGLFRTFKRTLAKVKLMSRTVRLVHREAEGALLATQLLLAQGVLAMGNRRERGPTAAGRCSPRKVLLAIRKVLSGKLDLRDKRFTQHLRAARRDERARKTGKEKRRWAQRVHHKVQKPPRFLKMKRSENALAEQLLDQTA